RQAIASKRDGNRTLGVRPQGQARRAKVRALLLKATGVRKNASSMPGKPERVVVAHRFDQFDFAAVFERKPEVAQFLACPWVNREDNRVVIGDSGKLIHDHAKRFATI